MCLDLMSDSVELQPSAFINQSKYMIFYTLLDREGQKCGFSALLVYSSPTVPVFPSAQRQCRELNLQPDQLNKLKIIIP